MHIQKYYEGNLGLLSEADRTMYINSQKEDVRDTVSRSRIDFTMTQYNYNLCPHDQYTSKELVKKHMIIRNRQLKNIGSKKDVVFGSVIVTLPKDFKGDPDIFFEVAYDVLKEEFRLTDDDVISAYVHMDEHRPHMHFYFLPISRENDIIKMNWDRVCPRSLYERLHSDMERKISDELGVEVHLLNDETLGIGNSQYLTHEQKDLLVELEQLRKERAAEYAEAPGFRDKIKNINKDIQYYTKQEDKDKVQELNDDLIVFKAKQASNKDRIKALTSDIHSIEDKVSKTKQNKHQKREVSRIIKITNESEKLYEEQFKVAQCLDKMENLNQELDEKELVISNLKSQIGELKELVTERQKKDMEKKLEKKLPKLERKAKNVNVQIEEYDRLIKSAETREKHDERESELNAREHDLQERELELKYDKYYLDNREEKLNREIEKGIEDRMPKEVKKREQLLIEQEEDYKRRKEELQKKEEEYKKNESILNRLIINFLSLINRLVQKHFEKFIKEQIEKHKLKEVVSELAITMHGEKQKIAIEIIKDIPVDDVAKEELKGIGVRTKDDMTVGDAMAAATAKDIRLELMKRGVAPSEFEDYNVIRIREMIEKGVPEDNAFENGIKEIEEEMEKLASR